MSKVFSETQGPVGDDCFDDCAGRDNMKGLFERHGITRWYDRIVFPRDLATKSCNPDHEQCDLESHTESVEYSSEQRR